MKKILSLALLAALSATLLQCTKEINDENPKNPVNKTMITFTVQGDTKVSCSEEGGTLYPFTWESGDKLFVYSDKGYHGYLSNSGGTNKFAGEVTIPSNANTLFFAHLGKEVPVDNGNVDFSFISNQYGKLNGEHSIMNNIITYSDDYEYDPDIHN